MPIEIPPATRCLLCGQRFAPDWSNPQSEHPNGRFLLCAAHDGEELTAAGLENIWIGSGNWSPDFRPGRGGSVLRQAWLTPAEERGIYTVALLLDSDDLVVVGCTYANLDVAWLRRDLEAVRPEGLVAVEAIATAALPAPDLEWLQRARNEGYYLSFIQRHWGGLALRFNRTEKNEHLGLVAGERLGALLIEAEALGRPAREIEYGLCFEWLPA
jgi:hypothetical protein